MLLVKLINNKKKQYIDAFNKKDLFFDKRDLANINEITKMQSKIEYTKMFNITYIFFKSKYTISKQLKSRIKFI